MDKVAILVDGGFFQRKAKELWEPLGPKDLAKELHRYCRAHLKPPRHHHTSQADDLYRIFYYDCPPSDKTVYHPFLKTQVNLKNTDLYRYMTSFHDEMTNLRKVALRLGILADSYCNYLLRPNVVKKLCNGAIKITDLKESDFFLDIKQKGVDMRIAIDIASMACKKQVTKVVLVSGDSDFVPAAKMARREGIDFVLDPMGGQIRKELNEHIDGIRSPWLGRGASVPTPENKTL